MRPELRERVPDAPRHARGRAFRLRVSEMADPEALAAALEKEKAALVAEKAKSKSNLSKVVLLSKEKKALEAELEAARVLAQDSAALSEEQGSKLRAAEAAAAEAEEKILALRIEVEAAQVSRSEREIPTLPPDFLKKVKILVCADAKSGGIKWSVPKLRKHLNGACRLVSRAERWLPESS